MNLSAQMKMDLFSSMMRIHCLEKSVAELYKEQEMRTPTRLSIGQEAVCRNGPTFT